MEIIIMLLGIVGMIGVIIEDKSLKTKLVIMSLSLLLTTSTYYIAKAYTTEIVTERTDVITYGNITYSTPQSLIETHYDAPWWSRQDKTTYIVKTK